MSSSCQLLPNILVLLQLKFHLFVSFQIILHSMHRYHPRFHIVQADELFSVRWSVFQTFTFPETSFTAVTAYQNTKVSLVSIVVVNVTAFNEWTFYREKRYYFSNEIFKPMIISTDNKAEDRSQPVCKRFPRRRDKFKKVWGCYFPRRLRLSQHFNITEYNSVLLWWTWCVSICRRSNKNPVGSEKRAKITSIQNRESDEDGRPGRDSFYNVHLVVVVTDVVIVR